MSKMSVVSVVETHIRFKDETRVNPAMLIRLGFQLYAFEKLADAVYIMCLYGILMYYIKRVVTFHGKFLTFRLPHVQQNCVHYDS